MQKAGGIIGLVAGIFGVFAAIITLGVGGLGAAVSAQNASSVVLLGWGGLAFSFCTIVLGAVAMGTRTQTPGRLLIVCAIGGAVLGGTMVAIFMVLALIGGILAIIGVRQQAAAAALPSGS